MPWNNTRDSAKSSVRREAAATRLAGLTLASARSWRVRTVDAHVYGGGEDLERIKRQATEVLSYFVAYCHHHGLAAKAFLAFGTDPIEELTNLAEKIYSEFPHSIFFTSKLIFERDNWYIRQLHSEAALTMLRRLHLRNMPMVILPMKL